MGRSTSEGWFSIDLDESYIVTQEQIPNTSSESTSDPQQNQLHGTITLRLSKPTKIKSLSLTFTGYARTSFCFDSSSIPGAMPCASHVISTKSININYQVTASLQTPSILPFGSTHTISKPVILLQKDELPSDDLFDTTVMRVSSEDTDRVSCKVSIPCAVFPEAGTIPLTLNLSLKGNATTVSRITIEMMESVYTRLSPKTNQEERNETLIDERVVTRQNCPVHDWPSSTTEEPVMIPRRLLFKVPQLALSAWSKSKHLTLSCQRSSLDRGFCHSSGTFAHADIRIAHTIRVTVYVRGLSEDGGSSVAYDYGENETTVWIVGNQEYKDDEVHPPSYYRSFSTKLVEEDKIQEIDQRAFEALQDDLPCSAPPPYCEESFVGTSASSSPTLTSLTDHGRISLDQFSLNESLAESTNDNDTYARDLATYTERYSYSSPAVLAM
ncbi:hypothetical protein BGZ80_003946 [Entomortierella chlamydospora]|uniref:Uncharacterized protein n=1 Tax=Entomortierella chlamydospora TaxID=101097 RepID=A0A9P6MMS9_9FUNG|nr:hypothetical protein BGZ80_003946 [Entomortierella chlamydospora]